MHGNFAWYELMTTDVAASKAFYGAVTGWTARSMGESSNYTVFSAGDYGVAGMMALTDEMRAGGARPAWMGYISVDDVDATVAELTKAGGKVYRPAADVPDMLRFAVVADPQDVPFVVFTPNPRMQAPPAPPPETPGLFGWRELVTTDWQAAWTFYSGLFGWTKAMAVDMGPMGVYQTFGVGGGEAMGGMMDKPAAIPAPYWAYYILVDSIDAAIARFKAAGGTLISGPHEVPGPMYTAQGLDPQGALFSLLSAKP
jgi:predicted enzyme related to lactoylglutathione lyase